MKARCRLLYSWKMDLQLKDLADKSIMTSADLEPCSSTSVLLPPLPLPPLPLLLLSASGLSYPVGLSVLFTVTAGVLCLLSARTAAAACCSA
jgi:hypothetical protein